MPPSLNAARNSGCSAAFSSPIANSGTSASALRMSTTSIAASSILDVHRDVARARSVELDEVDALPPAEVEGAAAIGPVQRRADQHRKEMRVGVSFTVTKANARHERAQRV